MPATGRVAFILKGYPRLSETFIAQEIAALEARDGEAAGRLLRLHVQRTGTALLEVFASHRLNVPAASP